MNKIDCDVNKFDKKFSNNQERTYILEWKKEL